MYIYIYTRTTARASRALRFFAALALAAISKSNTTILCVTFQDGIKDDCRSPRILRDPRSMQKALEIVWKPR